MPTTLFGNNVNHYTEKATQTPPAPQRNTVNIWFWSTLLLVSYWLVTSHLSCTPLTTRSSSLESQVRTWASDYPTDLRNRWAWCYIDSTENWSTDQKLRDDVRLKSAQVLTSEQREVLQPLDQQIAEAVSKQKTELKETYLAVGHGLKVAEWKPLETANDRLQDDEPRPPPIRHKIFNRQRILRLTNH